MSVPGASTLSPAARIAALLGARRSGRGWIARCPAHDDRSPSLSIAEGRDGRVLLHCHAGCRLDDILEALSLARRDLYAGRQLSPKQAQQSALVRERQQAEAHARRIAHGTACDRVQRLQRVVDELGARLARLPDGTGGELVALMCRTLDQQRVAEQREEGLRP